MNPNFETRKRRAKVFVDQLGDQPMIREAVTIASRKKQRRWIHIIIAINGEEGVEQLSITHKPCAPGEAAEKVKRVINRENDDCGNYFDNFVDGRGF